MKKKLMALFILLLIGTLIIGMTACNNTESDDGTTDGGTTDGGTTDGGTTDGGTTDGGTTDGGTTDGGTTDGGTIRNTITDDVWKAGVGNSGTTADKTGMEVTYSYNRDIPGAPLSIVTKYDGNKIYQKEIYSTEIMNSEKYMVYDDANFTVKTYLALGGEWVVSSQTYSSQEYSELKAIAYGYNDISGEDYRLTSDGENKSMEDLFSAFTYDEENGVYKATLYTAGGEIDGNLIYTPNNFTFKFENDKIVEMTSEGTYITGDTFKLVSKMLYDVSITLPTVD